MQKIKIGGLPLLCLISVFLLGGLQNTATANVLDAVTKAGNLLSNKEANNSSGEGYIQVASSGGTTPSLGDGPSDNLVKLTKCADLELTNVMTGNYGEYTFTSGLSEEARQGLINRKPGKITRGCIAPSLEPRQILYLEVDTEKYTSMGNSNDWKMQCVRSEDPGAGLVTADIPTGDDLNYTALMLHCGHSEENVEACEEGSNSQRGQKYSALLESRGKTMITVFPKDGVYDSPPHGEKVYCQFYNKPSKTSMFAFEYIRIGR